MYSNQPWFQEFESLSLDDQSKVIDFVHALATRKARPEPEASDEQKPSAFDQIKDLVGIVEDGPMDLSTNPKHLQGYGR